MDLAILMFPTDQTIAPDELARAVEDRGFESLWFPEHTHMPVEHAPHPAGGELPEMYKRTFDPFVALTAAAAATTNLRIGTGICLVAQHHPINLAKQVASLDRLSDGRFEFGVGYGWNAPETEHHGVAFEHRREFVRESVLAMKSLWTEDVAVYQGDHVSFGPTYQWPKPAQRPHPPILLGARLGPSTRAAILEFCDGWMPIGRRALESDLPEIRRALQEVGRGPEDFVTFVYGTKPDPDQIDALADLGVDRVGLWVRPGPEPEVIRDLDRLARLVR